MADVDFNNFEGVIGNPVNPYAQTYSDTCAIKSQQIILNEFGVPVTEDQLVQYSVDHGWYNGNGTQFEDVGKLLVDAGIPCSHIPEANVYDLANELAQGHKVIVGVDSGELWDNGILDWLKDIFVGDTPDHAIIVAGIDMTDPNNPMVIITDPGTGQPAQPYPLDQFMDAWADSQNFIVSTDIPTPTAVDQFTANGFNEMHLPEIAGVDFNTFQGFQSYSHMIEPNLLPDLYQAFQAYPTMLDLDFSTMLDSYNLPIYDMSSFMPNPTFFDPMSFDYQGLSDLSWMTPENPDPIDTGITDHTREVLTDLHQSALDHAQQCLDDGMYVTAQMWQQQANDIQSDLNDL